MGENSTDGAEEHVESFEAIQRERIQLESEGRLHLTHWAVVIGSLLLTITAWWFSKNAVEDRIQIAFDRESEQVVELIRERMRSYEDALWAGVALYDASDTVTEEEWRMFARSLGVGERYPGINGIGVIYNVPSAELAAFVAAEQKSGRPEFSVFPAHGLSISLPIVFIEPVADNLEAVGLDVAHESNRFIAALKARDNGTAQITGPVQLVQDAAKTPGFLFYAPVYKSGHAADATAGARTFEKLVYAPFIVNKLMQGILDRERRQVGVSIRDTGETIYSEHTTEEPDYDANPIHTMVVDLPVYGRTWQLELRSARSFRAANASAQPWIVLATGIFIDLLLLVLFIQMARSSRRALSFASRMVGGYSDKTTRLESAVQQLRHSNSELEQFAYIASHDLQEPLRTLISFSGILESEVVSGKNTKVDASVKYIGQAASRMRDLVSALLGFSRIGTNSTAKDVDCTPLLDAVIADLGGTISATGAQIEVVPLPTMRVCETEIRQLFQNLLSNALKFMPPGKSPQIAIGYERTGRLHKFSVKDNGVGLDAKYAEKIFLIFQRLHGHSEFSGSGIGLANCKKIVNRHGGEIWVDSALGEGATFHFTLAVVGPNATIRGTRRLVRVVDPNAA
ncbi:MAG: signal transduction histidine kinase [Myxococcota bacterium]|jgi:signal transduction histidine kinase